jgi:hypothetical protein
MIELASTYYKNLWDDSSQIIDRSFESDFSQRISEAHSFIGDFPTWLEVLNLRSEFLLYKTAKTEYELGLLNILTGKYRAAFASLRLTLEMSLSGILWSTNELALREWKQGNRDTNWHQITDKENGIFSKRFVRLFTDALEEDVSSYGTQAVAIYRECSEFVHANSSTHAFMPTDLGFSGELLDQWLAKADSCAMVILFSFCVRYLKDMSNQEMTKIRDATLDRLGHSDVLRALLA